MQAFKTVSVMFKIKIHLLGVDALFSSPKSIKYFKLLFSPRNWFKIFRAIWRKPNVERNGFDRFGIALYII